MYKTRVLIISERKELSIKYKKLIEALNQDVVITNDLSYALSIIQKQENEFIVISDTIKEKLNEFIKKIRVLTFNSRPIIIAVSKSGDLDEKLKILESGADDFINEEITKQEFHMRFKAHLRRFIESNLNPITHLPDKNITIKAIKKSFEIEGQLAYLYLKINQIDLYRKTHGEIAYEKVLQTLCAIIGSTSTQEDYFGHVVDDEFVLITHNSQAEKIASFLTFAFDNILNKFYSSDEFENNFTLESGDEIKESKKGLMRLHVSSIEKDNNKKDHKEILNNLSELIKLCEKSKTSTYVIDRIKLKGEVKEQEKKNKILIFEPDSALSCLLKNVCEMQDIIVQVALNEAEFKQKYKSFNPNVVLLDWGTKNETNSLKLARATSKDDIKLIFTSSYLNKKEILKAGADLYVPKPYEIDDMIEWIKKFLK